MFTNIRQNNQRQHLNVKPLNVKPLNVKIMTKFNKFIYPYWGPFVWNHCSVNSKPVFGDFHLPLKQTFIYKGYLETIKLI